MKTVIYYYSKHGHTKNYAESLMNRIDKADVFSYKEMKVKNMKTYDTIIFMGPVHGNKISHLNQFLKHYEKIKDKNLIIVAVGMQMPNPDRRESLIISNLLKYYHVRLYELVGGFDASKLSPFMRKLMNIGLKTAMKKDPTLKANENRINDIFKYPFEYNDINGIEKILDTIHKLERDNKVI